jgi:uncharacterized phage-associated protein
MNPFVSSLSKKIQAAGVVLRDRGAMDRLRLLKVLYIADREALKERGSPILGGLVVAMKHGPLHSEVLDYINRNRARSGTWSEYIGNQGFSVFLIQDPGNLDLSPYEVEKLNEVADRYAVLDTWELSELSHEFEEWKESFVVGTSTAISPESLMKAVGFNAEEIRGILEDARAHSRLAKLAGA